MMLSHLTPMIAALSLALTAGSSDGWSRLSSMFEQRCTKSHDHVAKGPAQPNRRVVVKRHQLYEAQLLSIGP